LGLYEGSQVIIKNGKFGPYIKWNKVNGRLPPEYKDNPASIPLDFAIKILEEKGTGKKASKKKDTKKEEKVAQPKKKTAYQVFMSTKRSELASEGLAFGEITKRVAALWKETTEDDKSQFQKLADELNSQIIQESGTSNTGKKETSKKKRTGYQCFSSEKRPELAEKGLAFGEITKEIASQWKEMDEDAKAKYQQMADEYNKEQGVQISSKSAQKNAVKRKTAYNIFTSEMRHKVAAEGLSFGEVTKKVATLWKGISEEEKQKYNDMAHEHNSKITPVENGGSASRQKAGKPKSKKSLAKKQSPNSSGNVKRPKSAYMFFSSENRAEEFRKLKTLGEVAKSLALKWKSLTETEKEPYIRMSEKDKERYIEELKKKEQKDPSLVI